MEFHRVTVTQFWRRARFYQMVDLWSSELGVAEAVRVHPISRWQVTGPDNRRGASLVGVVERMGVATIYHTRRLHEDDVVHVRFPQMCHEEVEAWTNTLVEARRRGCLPKTIAKLLREGGEQYAAADAAG